MIKFFRKPGFVIGIILVLAALLRFYHLADYIQFLGDQGRDVLVVKRMIVDHRFTLLGPNASVGGFFTGPIYYYFMLPFLWASNLDPAGPAFMSAIFGVATIWLLFLFCRELFGTRTALLAAFLAATSVKMVEVSRYAWNPNPVPFFALLALFTLYLAATRKRLGFTLVSGFSLGVMYQLHYINLAFIPLTGLVLLLIFPRKEWLVQIVILSAGFVLGVAPFLFFEARHGFPNTRSVWEFVTRRGQTVAPRSSDLIFLEVEMLRRLYEAVLRFQYPVLPVSVYASIGALAAWVAMRIREGGRRVGLVIILVWVVVGLFGVGSYRGQLYDHYFVYLYPIPFILLAIIGEFLLSRIWTRLLFVAGVVGFLYLEFSVMYFQQPPNKMIDQTKEIAQTVVDFSQNQPFNFALVADTNSDQAYRYFLEIWGRNPVTIENPAVDPDRRTVTGQLVVVCERKNCQLYGNSLWEIAGFGQAQIVGEKDGPAGIKIYKLVHYNQTQNSKLKT